MASKASGNASPNAYPIARMIEVYVPPKERVFVLTQVAESYTTRDILVGYQGGLNHTIGDILWTPIVDDFHPRRHVVQHLRRRCCLGADA